VFVPVLCLTHSLSRLFGLLHLIYLVFIVIVYCLGQKQSKLFLQVVVVFMLCCLVEPVGIFS